MDEVLFKLNMVKNNNQIVRLKYKNKINNLKTVQLVNSYKKMVKKYQDKTTSEINNLKEKVKNLEEENQKMYAKNQLYKNTLDRIPNFIVRIFVGRKIKLLKD